MCESNAYMKEKKGETLLMKDVAKMEPAGAGKWRMETILGDEIVVAGKVITIDFEGHKILLAP